MPRAQKALIDVKSLLVTGPFLPLANGWTARGRWAAGTLRSPPGRGTHFPQRPAGAPMRMAVEGLIPVMRARINKQLSFLQTLMPR